MPSTRRIELELQILEAKRASFESQMAYAVANYNLTGSQGDSDYLDVDLKDLTLSETRSPSGSLRKSWNSSSSRAREIRRLRFRGLGLLGQAGHRNTRAPLKPPSLDGWRIRSKKPVAETEEDRQSLIDGSHPFPREFAEDAPNSSLVD